MWPEGEEGRIAPTRSNNETRSGSGSGTDVATLDSQMASVARNGGIPNVANLNVTKSSKVHIGPKFISVNQTVQNNEVVKELSCPAYVWNVIKNSSRTERLACAAALLILIVCTVLIVYFTVLGQDTTEEIADRAPHEWFITRDMWLASWFNNSARTDDFNPLRLVIVQHTVSPECHRFIICAAELRNLQNYFITSLGYDIPYNFMVGNDGRIYVGRGWGMEAAHTRGLNRCSVGLGFLGDYREELQVHTTVSESQVNRTQILLDEGVRLGYLHPEYVVLGASDVRYTESPGSNLLREIRQWPHYGHDKEYRNLDCEEIYAKYNITINS